jgi:hypothetical protein
MQWLEPRTKESLANPYNEEPQTGKDVIFMPQMARSINAAIKFQQFKIKWILNWSNQPTRPRKQSVAWK